MDNLFVAIMVCNGLSALFLSYKSVKDSWRNRNTILAIIGNATFWTILYELVK